MLIVGGSLLFQDDLQRAWLRARRAMRAATKGDRSYRDFLKRELLGALHTHV